MPLFEAKKVSTMAEYVDALREVSAAGATRWFRGHGKTTYKLIPSLGRLQKVGSELALIKRFKQNAVALMAQPPTAPWHWLFLMQHHRAPTRLLDWSENPLVALYFAVANPDHDQHDGDVWCLDPVGLNKAAYVQPTPIGELPFFGMDEELDQYTTESINKSGADKPPVAALAARYFPRLIAQSGVFTVTHREQVALEDAHGGAHVGRITIPRTSKESLRRDLAVLGITKLALFPELDSVADFAMQVLS